MPTDLLTLLSPKNILIFVLVITRISGLLLSAPLFSTFPIPVNVKALIAVVIGFLLLPSVIGLNLTLPTSMPAVAVFLLKEFAIGFLIGFLANLIFISCQVGAEILGIQSGLSFSTIMDPSTGATNSIMAQLYIYPLGLLFLMLNFHHWLFLTVGYSFKSIQPGFDVFFAPDLVQQILHLSAQIFVVAIGLVLPVFAVMFVTEILLGFVSKMMPRMNVFMIALPIKIYLGLVLILLFLAPSFAYMTGVLEERCLTIMKLFTGGS